MILDEGTFDQTVSEFVSNLDFMLEVGTFEECISSTLALGVDSTYFNLDRPGNVPTIYCFCSL